MERLAIVGACLLVWSSAHACDVCEGSVEATGKGIVVGGCNFLAKSELKRSCPPGKRCRV